VGPAVINAFVEAVRQVLGALDIPVDAVDEGGEPRDDDTVLTTVGITGELKGIFMFRTNGESAAAILAAMTGGFGVAAVRAERLDEMQMAAFGELANQVSGRAITLLSEIQVRCDITAPAVVAAEGLRSLVPDLAESFRRTVRGPFGRLSMFLGLSEPSRDRG
jgi:CheY-specific phosphatase CheX